MVFALAVVAALIVGIGTVLEQRAAAQAPPELNLSPRLLVYLAQRPLWLAGVGCSLLGNLTFAAALGVGGVALVQAVFTLRLLFALALAAAWGRHRIPVRDLVGGSLVVAGLISFLLASRPREDSGVQVPDLSWVIGGGAVVLIVAALTAAARRLGPVRKALLLGLGAGALFGLQASLMDTAVGLLTGPGVVALATSWTGYSVVAVALTGMLLVQSAYEAAPLPASYPAIVTTELLVAIAFGVLLLGGGISTDPVGLSVGIVGVLAMVLGIYLLTTSPLVTGQLDQLVRRQEIGTARQVELQLERELRRAERELNRAEARPRAATRSRRLQRELGRIEAGIHRLQTLQDDIAAHRAAERRCLDDKTDAEREDTETQDRLLRDHENTIEERARDLRARVATLR